MSNGELQARAERLLLDCLSSSGDAIRPRDLYEAGSQETDPIPLFTVRLAVWNLVNDGKIEFTSDWRLRLTG